MPGVPGAGIGPRVRRRGAAGPTPGEPPQPRDEEALQADWAAYLAVALPDGAVHHHSPNEGRRGWQAQRALKSGGVLAGMPDSMILWQGRAYFLELKMPGRRPTPVQVACHAALRAAGCPVAVGSTLAELHAHAAGWGIPFRVGPEEWLRCRRAPRLSAAEFRAAFGGGRR